MGGYTMYCIYTRFSKGIKFLVIQLYVDVYLCQGKLVKTRFHKSDIHFYQSG